MLEKIAFYVLHGCVFIVAIYVTFLSMPGSSLFSWHPFLMTLAVISYSYYISF